MDCMPRQARLDYPGTLHHVICRGIEKKDIVSDDRDRDYFIERFGNLAAKTDTAVYACERYGIPMALGHVKQGSPLRLFQNS